MIEIFAAYSPQCRQICQGNKILNKERRDYLIDQQLYGRLTIKVATFGRQNSKQVAKEGSYKNELFRILKNASHTYTRKAK